jgi:predicted outer membrane protein
MKAMSLFAALAMVLTLVVAGSAQQKSWNGKMPTGKAFLTKAAEINLGEIELGKLAQQKGRRPQQGRNATGAACQAGRCHIAQNGWIERSPPKTATLW